MKMSQWLCAMAISTLGLSACGHDITSNAKLAATSDHDTVDRHTALDVISDAVCHRQNDLGKIGTSGDAKYSDIDDCKAKERDHWASTWSEDKCGAGHGLYAGKVRDCKERAQTWQASGNVLDFGGLLTECSAGSVCRS